VTWRWRWLRVASLVVLLVALSCCTAKHCSRDQTPLEDLGLTRADLTAGWVIGDPFGKPPLGLSVYTRGDSALVRLEVGAGGDGNGHALWRPLDQVWVPIQSDSAWIAGDLLCPCYMAGASDAKVFALVQGRARGEKSPLRAWRADPQKGRIEEIPRDRVHCTLRRSLSE
jgi:hypothetical protein